MYLFEIIADCKSKDGIITSIGFTTIKAETVIDAIKQYHQIKKGFDVFVKKVEIIGAIN